MAKKLTMKIKTQDNNLGFVYSSEFSAIDKDAYFLNGLPYYGSMGNLDVPIRQHIQIPKKGIAKVLAVVKRINTEYGRDETCFEIAFSGTYRYHVPVKYFKLHQEELHGFKHVKLIK